MSKLDAPRWVVMGVAGCGKSSVGAALAGRLADAVRGRFGSPS